jgi:hypothetical protein
MDGALETWQVSHQRFHQSWEQASTDWKDTRRDELERRHIEPLDRQATLTGAALAELETTITWALAVLRKLE